MARTHKVYFGSKNFCLDLGLLNASALTANVNFSGAICCVVGSRVRLALP